MIPTKTATGPGPLTKEIPQIEVREAARWRERGGTLLDCREADEVASVRAQGVRHVPLSWLRQADRAAIAALGLAQPVDLICRSGQRSMVAATILRAAGVDDVRNVAGGTIAWIEAGLPVERGG